MHGINDSCIRALKHHGLLPLPRPLAARAVFLVSSHNRTSALQAGGGGGGSRSLTAYNYHYRESRLNVKGKIIFQMARASS